PRPRQVNDRSCLERRGWTASIMLGEPSRRSCRRRVSRSRNKGPSLPGVAALGAWVLALSAAWPALFAGPARAQRTPQPFVQQAPVQVRDGSGYFGVQQARIQLVEGVYFLDALIEYRLSSEATEALLAGVPLTIEIDMQVTSPRRFWFDNEKAKLEQRFELLYRAVSERFLVRNLNTGQNESFPTLQTALAYLGRIESFPIIDADLLDADETYHPRMRTALDIEKFPGPLRLLA